MCFFYISYKGRYHNTVKNQAGRQLHNILKTKGLKRKHTWGRPSTADLLKHGENALLAEKEDTDTLGRNLAAVCRDPGLAGKLSQAQGELTSSFWTWEERMKVEVEELERLMLNSFLESVVSQDKSG